MKYVIGIDPGAKGAICLVNENNKVLYLNDMSNNLELISLRLNDIIECIDKNIIDIKNVSVFLESAISANTNRKINNHLFFMNGFITGISFSHNLEIIHTHPSHWKKIMGVSSDKDTSIRKAVELFPDVKDKIIYAHGSYKDGLSESLLIAYYGLHLNKYYPEMSQIQKKQNKRVNQEEIEI